MVPTSERFVGPESGRLVTLFYHSATGDGATSWLTASETMRCGHYTPATAECRAAWRHRTHWVMVQAAQIATQIQLLHCRELLLQSD